MMDFVPPQCKSNGEYEPLQCHFGGCYCSLSDGTPIERTLHRANVRGTNTPNCTQLVYQRQRSQAAGVTITPSGNYVCY